MAHLSHDLFHFDGLLSLFRWTTVQTVDSCRVINQFFLCLPLFILPSIYPNITFFSKLALSCEVAKLSKGRCNYHGLKGRVSILLKTHSLVFIALQRNTKQPFSTSELEGINPLQVGFSDHPQMDSASFITIEKIMYHTDLWFSGHISITLISP